jgi:hypothetical protein
MWWVLLCCRFGFWIQYSILLILFRGNLIESLLMSVSDFWKPLTLCGDWNRWRMKTCWKGLVQRLLFHEAIRHLINTSLSVRASVSCLVDLLIMFFFYLAAAPTSGRCLPRAPAYPRWSGCCRLAGGCLGCRSNLSEWPLRWSPFTSHPVI